MSAFRTRFLCAVAGLALASADAIDAGAQPAAPARSAPATQNYTLAFQDAELPQVVEEVLGRTLGLSYTIEAGVSARVSFRVDQRLTKAQLLDAFETALASSDIVLVRQGEGLLVTSRAKARGTARVGAPGAAPSRGGYQMVPVPLNTATPSEAAKALQAMGFGETVVVADDKSGQLILGGSASEIDAAQQVLKVLDRPVAGASRNRMVEVRNVAASTIAADLTDVLKATSLTGVQVVPIDRLRSVLIIARNDQALNEAAGWVARLDAASTGAESTLWVYRPKNVGADALGATLRSVLGDEREDGPSPTPAAAPPASTSNTFTNPISSGLGTPAAVRPSAATPPIAALGKTSMPDGIRVAIDHDGNALLISAPPGRRVEIERLLKEIDVLPRQILVEASILEVTLGDEFSLGVNWSILSSNGRLRITSSNDETGAVAPTFPGVSVTYIGGDIQAALDALRARTNVKVVSAPKLVALDNRTAHLQIGDQVPVATQASQSTVTPDAPRLVTIDYRNTGVILDVTPRITGEDGVTITVSQEVSSVARTTTSGIDSPTIRQRRFDSVVLLKNGGTVALGGLISSSQNDGVSGIPFFQDVPIFGPLFRSKDRDNRRTELIVLLTAKIIPDAAAAAKVASDMSASMKTLESNGLTSP